MNGNRFAIWLCGRKKCSCNCVLYADRLSKFKPQDISNTAWSLAVLGLWHGEFFDAAAEQVTRR